MAWLAPSLSTIHANCTERKPTWEVEPGKQEKGRSYFCHIPQISGKPNTPRLPTKTWIIIARRQHQGMTLASIKFYCRLSTATVWPLCETGCGTGLDPAVLFFFCSSCCICSNLHNLPRTITILWSPLLQRYHLCCWPCSSFVNAKLVTQQAALSLFLFSPVHQFKIFSKSALC